MSRNDVDKFNYSKISVSEGVHLKINLQTNNGLQLFYK